MNHQTGDRHPHPEQDRISCNMRINRTFKVEEELSVRLSHVAYMLSSSTSVLVGRALDEFVLDPTPIKELGSPKRTVLRSYSLTKEQDKLLDHLALIFQVSRTKVLDMALNQLIGCKEWHYGPVT